MQLSHVILSRDITAQHHRYSWECRERNNYYITVEIVKQYLEMPFGSRSSGCRHYASLERCQQVSCMYSIGVCHQILYINCASVLSTRLKWSCLMFSTSEAKGSEHLNYSPGLDWTAPANLVVREEFAKFYNFFSSFLLGTLTRPETVDKW